MKTLLLTGASGFVGSHIKAHYEKKGWRILTLGRRDTDDFFWDGKGQRNIIFDRPVNIDRVIHSLAVNEVEISNDVVTSYDINVTLTKSLCEFSKKMGVNDFIYISTFHVYGKESGFFSTKEICNPINDYGLTHYLSEEVIRNTLRGSSINALILRPTNIYGVPIDLKSFNRWSLAPFAFIKESLEKGSITLRSSGKQLRNFVHIDSLLHSYPSGFEYEIRNVFGEKTLSILQFANLVAKELQTHYGQKINIYHPTLKEKKSIKSKSFSFDDVEQEFHKGQSLCSFIIDLSNALKVGN